MEKANIKIRDIDDFQAKNSQLGSNTKENPKKPEENWHKTEGESVVKKWKYSGKLENCYKRLALSHKGPIMQ